MKLWIKKTLKWVGIVCVLLVMGMGAGFAFFQTSFGKGLVIGWIGGALSGPGSSATAGKVQGVFPFDVRIDHLVLADKAGGWLFVHGFGFRISATQLLWGRLHVRDIQAREVRLERLPQTGKVEKKGGTMGAWHVPALPGVRVDRVRMDAFYVGAPILGRPMTFSVGGRLDTNAADRSIKGIFQVKRLDVPGAEADLSWTVSGDPAVLSVDLAASEEEGGVLASLLNMANVGPLRLTLKGTAPLADWNGDLKVSVVNFGALDCRLGWVMGNGFIMRAEGAIQLHESLLAGFPGDLLGREAHFGTEVEIRSGDTLTVRRATVTGEDVALDFSGRIKDESGAVNSAFQLTIPRLDAFPASGTNLSGSLRTEGKVTGTMDRPKIDLDLTAASGLRVGDLSADEMALHLEGQMNGGKTDNSKTWDLKGHGRIQGVRVAEVPQLPDGGPANLSFEAAGLPDGIIDVKGFHLANRDVKVGLSGKLDTNTPAFSGKMEGELQDLSRLSALSGVSLGGKTGFSADVAINSGTSVVSAAIKGAVEGFTSDLPILNALAWKGVRYGGQVSVNHGGNRVALSGIEMDSGRIKIVGEGGADLHADETSGRFHVSIPDLAFLSKPAGVQLSGSLTGGIQIHGPISAPILTASITTEPIDVSGVAFEKVEANIRTDRFTPDWSGDLDLEAVYGGQPLKLQGQYSVDRERLLFTGMSLDGPGAQAAGHARWDFANAVLEGAMTGEVEAPGLISEVLGQGIQGKAHLQVSANGDARGQDVQFNLSAPKIVSSYGKAEGLDVSGRIHDLFGHMAGEAKIKLVSLEKETTHIKGVTLIAKGEPHKVHFEGGVAGELEEEPFNLKAGGNLTLSSGGSILEMSLLEGGVAGHELALHGPARVRFVQQGFVLEKTEIRLDKSSLSAEGRAGPEGMAFHGRFEGIPLDVIRMSGLPHLKGIASGTVRITGPIHAPVAEADLEIKGLRPDGEVFDHLPDASIRASAHVEDGMFSSNAVLEGVSEKPIEATLKVPVAFRLSPFGFTFRSGGAMEGRLDAEVNLQTSASYFPSGDQRAKGELKAALSLSGSPDSPRLTGTLRLKGGAYDHLGLGLLLRDVDLQLTATDDQVEITTFRATDGEKGSIDLKGKATVGGSQPVHFELTGQLHEFKAVRQDNTTITASGPFAVKGSTKSMDVSGDLVLEPVEIRIPDQFPPEVVPLNVIEVHGGQSEMIEEQTNPEQTPAFPITLDLRLNMPERVFLRGRGLDSEWEGKLRIKGSAKRPSVTGNLSVVRGTANVLGQVFRLTSGSVVFDGAFPPSPQLDLIAEKKSTDMTASIHVTGTPSAFSIKLESDPPLPSDEILSRVLFGKSTTQISPVQALTLAQSISELSGQKTLGVFDRTRKMLGLDQLGVTQSDGAQGGTAVSVGKYVGNNVYLQAQKTVTGQGGKVGMEVDVTPNIKLDTEAGTDAAQVGVIWQWEY